MAIHKPTRRNVRLDTLGVDREVQRASLDQKRVHDIMSHFSWPAFGTLVVSERDYDTPIPVHLIDGQTRHAAAMALGHSAVEVDAAVYTGLTPDEEAVMFRLLNNSKALSPIDRFRVRYVENDEAVVALTDMLSKFGWRVENSQQDGAFGAVVALERVWKMAPGDETDKLATVQHAIQVITEAWGLDTDGVRGELVHGIGALFARHGNAVDRAKLVKVFAMLPKGPLTLVGKAVGLRELRGGTLYDCVAESATVLHNKNKKASALPDWR